MRFTSLILFAVLVLASTFQSAWAAAKPEPLVIAYHGPHPGHHGNHRGYHGHHGHHGHHGGHHGHHGNHGFFG